MSHTIELNEEELASFLEAGPIDVSVCIANWNCRELLRDCLASLHRRPQGVRWSSICMGMAARWA